MPSAAYIYMYIYTHTHMHIYVKAFVLILCVKLHTVSTYGVCQALWLVSVLPGYLHSNTPTWQVLLLPTSSKWVCLCWSSKKLRNLSKLVNGGAGLEPRSLTLRLQSELLAASHGTWERIRAVKCIHPPPTTIDIQSSAREGALFSCFYFQDLTTDS